MKLSISFKSEDFKKKIEGILLKVLSQSNMSKWMKETALDIKKRTRLGYGVESDLQAKKPLKELSPGYIKWRKGDTTKIVIGKTKKGRNRTKTIYNRLSPTTKPSKSNLTLSGQMLDSLDGSSDAPFKGTIFLNDSRSGDSFTNSQLAEWNSKKGRNFFAVSDLEYQRLVQKIQKSLVQALRKTYK